MTVAHIVVPFRDRGRDPLRAANLECVLEWWEHAPWPVHVVDDGRTGDAQFNRSAAYNRGLELVRDLGGDTVIYTESDMLVPWEQIEKSVEMAAGRLGLVVGFTSYRYLSEDAANKVRNGESPVGKLAKTIDNGASIGAVNIVSSATMRAVGQWDETFEGSWYDDTAMFRAFEVAAGKTRWVDGPGWHLYHLPGWTGDHLTDEDKAATARNAARCGLYRFAETPDRIRELTAGGA
jgi:hypothetical protein